jgi:hypothetical protein
MYWINWDSVTRFFFHWSLLLAMLFCSAGCYSHHAYQWTSLNLSEPGWKVWNGQAVWKPRKSIPELTGDVTLALNTNGAAFIQFTKTLPFATAHEDGRRWQIEFPGIGHLYSGHYPLPRVFAWFQLPALVEGRPIPKFWHEQGGPDDFHLRNSYSGETLAGYLSPQ